MQRRTVAFDLAARAEHARHGANQLSMSAQRAPTVEDCEDGWRRVREIVAVAEAAARDAARNAGDDGPSREAVRRAEAAARAARRLVDERNDTYTFHTASGFSFGEGWHVAAAALLTGAAIQIDPDEAGAASAERFLADAGLAGCVRPYRSRPRAMKQTTALVAAAFRADPVEAQRRVRRAFLGEEAPPRAVTDWTDARMAGRPRTQPKVLVWIRKGTHHPHRNSVHEELVALAALAEASGLVPILIGDAPRERAGLERAIDLTLFQREHLFRGRDTRRAQLHVFEHLRSAHGVVGQIGVFTAGMDGPALIGLPTTYLTDAPNVRLRAWVETVPGYREIVRDATYLERVRETFASMG